MDLVSGDVLHKDAGTVHSLDDILLNDLPPISAVLGAVYLLLAVGHPLFLQPSSASVLVPAAAVSALLLFIIAALAQRRVVHPHHAHAAATAIASIVLMNGLLQIVVTGELRQTTSLLLLIVGAGSLFLSTPWLGIVIVSTVVTWGFVVLAHPSPDLGASTGVLHFGVMLLAATALALLAHAVRKRSLARIRSLRRRDQEQKEALETALREARDSQDQYRDLLQSANDLVQSVAPDGSILYVNQAWHKTLGYTHDELGDLSIFDVIHPRFRDHCQAVLRRLTEERSSERLRTTFVTKRGEEIIVEGHVNCRYDDGRPVSTRGIFRDVTEQVEAEGTLQRQNRQLEARNAVAQALAGSRDLHALLTQALAGAMEALGFAAGVISLVDADTEALRLFSHSGLPDPLTESLETCGLDGTLCDLVYRGREPVHLEDLSRDAPVDATGLTELGLQAFAGAPIVHQGRVLGTFCLFHRSPRVLTEGDHTLLLAIGQQIGVAVENAGLFDEARRRRLYLEAVLSAAYDAVVTLDAEHQIVEWNAGAERLFGYTSNEVVGRNIDPLITTEEVYDQATGLTSTVMSGGSVPPIEAIRYRKDGTPIHVLIAGSPILIGGEFAGAVAIYTDIHELKEAQESLREYAAELEERNEELDAFAHTVAHDLKNPLQNLVGYADFLADEYEGLPADIRQEALITIVEAADRMHNIIGELLLLSEVRRGDVAPQRLDMADIVASAQTRLGYLISQYEAEIVTPDAWPTALGHPAWIEEVWANYLSNAVKYGGDPASGLPPRVEVGATILEDGIVRFWVRDNGPGLTPEEQARLFTPFTRLHQVKALGHGLGLSIVQRIMDKLGGGVGIESEPGAGSTFYFSLPQA